MPDARIRDEISTIEIPRGPNEEIAALTPGLVEEAQGYREPQERLR